METTGHARRIPTYYEPSESKWNGLSERAADGGVWVAWEVLDCGVQVMGFGPTEAAADASLDENRAKTMAILPEVLERRARFLETPA